jgi:hypothetical protein
MKKFLSTILTCLLLVSVVSTGVSAESIEELEVSSIVQGYLQAQADAKYLAKDENLTQNTLAAFSEDKVQKIQQMVDKAQMTRSASLANEIKVDSDFAEYMAEKAHFIQYTRKAEKLHISNYSVTYGTPDVEISGNIAKVEIFETVCMQYDGLDEMSAVSTEYVLNLVKAENDWVIVDITSDDMFDKAHSQEDFDYETAVEEYDAAMAVPGKIEVERDVTDQVDQLAASGANQTPYDRTSAANYSLTYTTSTNVNTRNYYNKNFYNFASLGGDCMNYASQCMYAGFGGSDDKTAIDSYAYPMDQSGSSWYTNSSGNKSPSWAGTVSFLNYANAANGTAPSQDNILFNVYYTNASDLKDIYNWQNRLLGSILLVNDDGHAMVISKVTGSSTSQIFVSAHTNDVKLVPLSQCLSAGDRSNGYHVIIPDSYYSYTNTPNCRVASKWQDAVAQNTTLNLSATAIRKSGGTVYRMAARVVTPSGAEKWLGEEYNTTSYNRSYQFAEKGLYQVTTYARELSSSANSVSSTISVRVY